MTAVSSRPSDDFPSRREITKVRNLRRPGPLISKENRLVSLLLRVGYENRTPTLMLKIQRIRERSGTRLFLSGDLRYAHLEEVRIEVASVTPPVTLDLGEVGLVDIDGIRLLNDCWTRGAKVENCAPYIRAWMRQERRETRR